MFVAALAWPFAKEKFAAGIDVRKLNLGTGLTTLDDYRIFEFRIVHHCHESSLSPARNSTIAPERLNDSARCPSVSAGGVAMINEEDMTSSFQLGPGELALAGNARVRIADMGEVYA